MPEKSWNSTVYCTSVPTTSGRVEWGNPVNFFKSIFLNIRVRWYFKPKLDCVCGKVQKMQSFKSFLYHFGIFVVDHLPSAVNFTLLILLNKFSIKKLLFTLGIMKMNPQFISVRSVSTNYVIRLNSTQLSEGNLDPAAKG